MSGLVGYTTRMKVDRLSSTTFYMQSTTMLSVSRGICKPIPPTLVLTVNETPLRCASVSISRDEAAKLLKKMRQTQKTS